MALGGALGLAWAPVTPRHFAWQAWHNLTSTFVSRGRRGTHGTGWRAWTGLGACDAAALCVAGVAQVVSLTPTVVSRGRRGTTSHPPSFHVAGVAQTHIHRRFAWQAWHSWHWVARLDWLGRPWRRGTLRGRRATTWHPPSFHVAGVAQPHIHLRFTWQAWHSWHWAACLDWLGRLWRRGTLRGRRGTNSHLLSFHVAGVAQPHIHLGFTWQAWHKLTSTVVLRGRRGTHGTGWRAWTGLGARDAAALCVAGVPQPDIHLRFTWQTWQAWHNLTSTFVSRGRRGTHGTGWRAWTGLGACDATALCVAGVAQTHTYCRFTWQARHNLTSTFVSRGRRGTNSHPPSFCVAGVALMALGGALGLAWAPVTPRHFAWQACHNLTSTFVSRGRRGTNSHPPSFCVAGVALMALGGALGLAWAPVTPRHFAWQACHNLTSTFVSRGRRGTTSHPPSFHGAGVALMALGGVLGLAWAPVTPRHFAWQAWHKLTPSVVSRGRRGTTSHPPSFHVAGVAQTHIHRRLAWQAWYRWHWVARLDWLGRPWRRGTLRGRRATTWHPPSFHAAGVAQTHIHRRFAWQAWHSWHWVARLDWLGRPWRRGTLRGRRATTWHPPSFHAAGVAQTHIHRRFAWQAWHSWHWVARLDWLGRPWRRGTLRGRRGTTWHPPSFHVAGVALMALGGVLGLAWAPVTPRHFAWQAWPGRGTTSQLVLCSGMSYGRVHHVVLVVLFWSLWPN